MYNLPSANKKVGKMSENKRYELRINVSIRDTTPGGGYLNIDESVEIDARDFLEMASILGKFHTLAEKIEKEGIRW